MTGRGAARRPPRRRLLPVLIFLATFTAPPIFGATEASAGCLTQSEAPKPPPFLIGVWQQPDDSFAKWRSRGVNTIVNDLWLQTSDSFATWEQDLACQDLYAIRPPEQPLSQENVDPRLLALAQQEEPDRSDTPASELQAQYEQWKAGAPSKAVFVNFSAPNIYEHQADLASLQIAYSAWIAGADWISEDMYPVSGYNRPDWIDLSETANPPTGFVENLLQQWSSGKPQFAFIEASNQSGAATYRAPTADEFRGEIWDAIIHGARGIFYLPQVFASGAPTVDDGVPPDLVVAMTNVDAQLASLGPMLVAPGSSRNVPGPFEAATRTYCGVTYTITLNFSHNAAYYDGTGFAPYQVEISPNPDPLPTCSSTPMGSGSGTPGTPGTSAAVTRRSDGSTTATTKRQARKRCPAPSRRKRSSSKRRTSCSPARPVKCKGAAKRSRVCKAPKRKSKSR